MLNNFGASYTLKNIDDEPYLEMIMLQLCLNYSAKAIDNNKTKQNFYSKENI